MLTLTSAMSLAGQKLTPTWSYQLGVSRSDSEIVYHSVFTIYNFAPGNTVFPGDPHGKNCSACRGVWYWKNTSVNTGINAIAEDSTMVIEVDSNMVKPENLAYVEFKLSDKGEWMPALAADCANGKVRIVLTPEIMGGPGIKTLHVRFTIKDGKRSVWRICPILPSIAFDKDSQSSTLYQFVVLKNSSPDKSGEFMAVWLYGMQKIFKYSSWPADEAMVLSIESALVQGRWSIAEHRIVSGPNIPPKLVPPPRDGIDGKPGPIGTAGKDGADGAPGKPGRDGKDGIDGKDAPILYGDVYIPINPGFNKDGTINWCIGYRVWVDGKAEIDTFTGNPYIYANRNVLIRHRGEKPYCVRIKFFDIRCQNELDKSDGVIVWVKHDPTGNPLWLDAVTPPKNPWDSPVRYLNGKKVK
jgi:hypothetical protein